MNVRTLLAALLVAGVAASFALPGFTEEPEAPAEPAAPEKPAAPDTTTPADPMAEAMAAAAKRGPNHEWMGFMAGSWDVAAKFWMGPGEPQTSSGRMETYWHMGRRFLRFNYSGEWEGKTFHGEATMGFNNTTGEYETAWIDDMSTAIARASGKREGDVITVTGTSVVPMMGEVSFRTVYTKKGDDSYVMEDTWDMPGMGEMKVMELTYTRAK